MIGIAICDDETEWIDTARDIVDKFFSEKAIEITIKTFNDAKQLLDEAAHDEPFDILILDIDMPDIDGFNAAEELKKLCPDMLLIFYTAYTNYVFDSFRFQPFRYIRKEYSVRELEPALLAAARVIECTAARRIELKCPGGTQVLKTSDIVYFETNKRRCDIYLKNDIIINVRKTIRELFAEIGSDGFVMIHSGSVVNIKYIRCFSSCDVTLKDGKRLHVSRPRSKEVKAAISDYWRKRI